MGIRYTSKSLVFIVHSITLMSWKVLLLEFVIDLFRFVVCLLSGFIHVYQIHSAFCKFHFLI